jgi:hypothetical protein
MIAKIETGKIEEKLKALSDFLRPAVKRSNNLLSGRFANPRHRMPLFIINWRWS